MERKPEQISRDIAAFERKLSEAGDNQVLKESLSKKIQKLKDELKGGKQSTKQLAYTLLGARKKVKELAAKDFRALILRLSKKPEYDFLKRYSAAKAKDDMQVPAKPVGYRFKGRGNYDTPTKREIAKGKKDGTVYYEARPRHSDVSRVIQLGKGGGVDSTNRYDKLMEEKYSLLNKLDSMSKLDSRYKIIQEKIQKLTKQIQRLENKMAKGGYVEGREEYKNWNYIIWYNPNKRMYSVSDSKGIFEGDNNYFKTYDEAKEHAEISISSMIDSDEMAKGGGVGRVPRQRFALYTNPNNVTNFAYVVIGNMEVKELLQYAREYPGSYRILYEGRGTNEDLQKMKSMFSNYRFGNEQIMAKGGGIEEMKKGVLYTIYDPGMNNWNEWEYISYTPGYHTFREEAPMGTGTEITFTDEELKDYLKENLIKYAKGGRMESDKIIPFEQVRPGMYATSVDDELFEVVAKGYGYEYDKKLKKYDRTGIVKDIKENPDNYGMEEGDFESQEWVVVNMENESNPAVYTYDTDGMVVYEKNLHMPLKMFLENFDYHIDEYFLREYDMTEEEMVQNIIHDLHLKSGDIYFEKGNFYVKGITKYGDSITIDQDGEFDMYGGPYTPKMEKPIVLLNNQDIYDKVRNEWENYLGGKEDEEIDISRVDIWGSVLKNKENDEIPGLNPENQLSITEVDNLYEQVPELDDPYYPKKLIKQVGDIAYYQVFANGNEYLLSIDTQGNWDDKWNIVKQNVTPAIPSITGSKVKESGAAEIRVELANGNITVYHAVSGEPLLTLEDVPQGSWEKLWDFLRNKLV